MKTVMSDSLSRLNWEQEVEIKGGTHGKSRTVQLAHLFFKQSQKQIPPLLVRGADHLATPTPAHTPQYLCFYIKDPWLNQ